MDNHFSGDKIIQLIGESGGKGTWTTARSRLPGGIAKKHLHAKKDTPINARSKAARYENPIVAVKHVTFPAGDPRKPYTVAHVTFQSTGGTNITCVNALSELKLFVRERSKGQGDTKRIWAIEMNEGRELYLKTYSGVDKIDQLLKEWCMRYVTWRWWHAPANHGKAIAGVMAYALYEQCAEGGVHPDWKMEKCMSAPEFRRKLNRQMCEYRAAALKYPGDEKLREATVYPKKRRGPMRAPQDVVDGTLRVNWDQYLAAKKPPRGPSRLCDGNLELMKKHLRSFKRGNGAICNVCGGKTFMKCTLCGVQCCLKNELKASSVSCSIDLHSAKFFGLLRCDRKAVFGEILTTYRKPPVTEVRKNAKHIKGFKDRYYEKYVKG